MVVSGGICADGPHLSPSPDPPFGAEKAPQSWSWENGNPKNSQSKCFSGVRQYELSK